MSEDDRRNQSRELAEERHSKGSQEAERKPVEYSFATQEELDAFLKGVEEASGWLEHDIIDDGDLRCPTCYVELELFKGSFHCFHCDYTHKEEE